MAARFFARSRAAYGRAPRRGGEAPRCAEAARSVVRASQPRRRDRARHRRERRRIRQAGIRSEEHTSELQSLMRISYAVFCLEKTHIQSHSFKTQNKRTEKQKKKNT